MEKKGERRRTRGSPKTHFSVQPRFLGTRGDHENERISFPALFTSNLETMNLASCLQRAESLTLPHTASHSPAAPIQSHEVYKTHLKAAVSKKK